MSFKSSCCGKRIDGNYNGVNGDIIDSAGKLIFNSVDGIDFRVNDVNIMQINANGSVNIYGQNGDVNALTICKPTGSGSLTVWESPCGTQVSEIANDGSFNVPSDRILKNNVKALSTMDMNQLLDTIKVYEYQMKNKDHTEIGFIAQEFVQNDKLKHLVHMPSANDKTMTLNYAGTTPLLWNMMTQLRGEIELLKNKVNTISTDSVKL